MEVGDMIQTPHYQRSNPNAQLLPFPILTGEHPLLISKTADGNSMVTNFRFCACERRSFINIPLMMIGELLVIETAKRLRIGCKDGSTYSCTFATTEDCNACTAMLKEKTGQPQNWNSLFAYRFYSIAMYKQSLQTNLTKLEDVNIQMCQPVDESFAYTFGKEVERLGFDTSRRRIWRMSHANDNFEFCPTYPKLHILPATVDDDKLKISLDFRALKRFPSVVWRDKRTGMVLIRSSQPLSSFLGLSYFTNHADVFLIEEIVNACNKDRMAIAEEEQMRAGRALPETEVNNHAGQQDGRGGHSPSKEDGAQGSLVCDDSAMAANGHGASNGGYFYDDSRSKLAIVDCRSLAGVWGNSFKGGGTEDEVVYKCNIVHLDLANIHTVRDSFHKLRALCHAYVEGTFYKNLTSCMWLTYISALLRGANIVVELMHVMRRPVLVHCSDGWDRTSQIVSLSELMMDKYYRTLEGFQVLVEREWLHFGHKFGERGGHDPNCSDTNQISPIFLQFLDCVYQLTLQYRAEFQFNETYLVKLLQHSQACLFGTFLYNCQKERENCPQKTASVWSLLRPERTDFVNLLYRPSDQVLTAKFSEHDVVPWKSVYMAGLSPRPHISQTDFYHDSTQAGGGDEIPSTVADGMPRSKSMDDLSKVSVDSGRRSSDPNIAQSQEVSGTAPDESLSAELLHYPDDSPHVTSRPSSSCKLEETLKNSPRKMSPISMTSIKQIQNGSKSPSHHSDMAGRVGASQMSDKDCATIKLHDASLGVTHPLAEQISENGYHDCVKLSDQPTNGEIGNVFLPEDSTAENLLPSSSAVFCQENGSSLGCNGQIVCCDTDFQVLSEKTNHSIVNDTINGCEVRKVKTHSRICSRSLDSVATLTNTSQKAASVSSSLTSGYSSKQTSLLSERLALTADLDMPLPGKELVVFTNVNGRAGHFSDPSNHHSKKSNDINIFHAALKAQAYNNKEVSRKLIMDIDHTPDYCNGDDRNCIHLSNGSVVEHGHHNGDGHLSNSLESQEFYNVDSSRGSCNSVSTDTLTGDSELSTSDLLPTPAAHVGSSKPLEVTVRPLEKFLATAPLASSSLTSSVLSSPLKRNSYPSDVNDSPGPNIISRQARAASGASRDLSVSPCTCRGNWSDTGRLRNPSGSDLASRRLLGATVSTSTTDISDSHVGQLAVPPVDRQPSVAQHIDIDGLTLFCDEQQDLLAELVAEKDRKIHNLERKLHNALKHIEATRGHNSQQQQSQSANIDDFVINSDIELGSLGAVSNAASDASWENIDESEAKLVLWVPDSAVTHCAGCDVEFRIYKRKHHCRNCGKVFCSECSNFLAPVPHQHLNKPERVCRRCHSNLLQLSPGASSDGRIPTLVADG